ncbi:pentapeptide repeat-containing protein [Streptosporangium sp. NBC_01469]|uniref:pentapeptide repeat-containing protein n=1 Tax=Streptosporangium sp. NBC_01469 TaxID=2903898 RepID=UPI003FCE410B
MAEDTSSDRTPSCGLVAARLGIAGNGPRPTDFRRPDQGGETLHEGCRPGWFRREGRRPEGRRPGRFRLGGFRLERRRPKAYRPEACQLEGCRLEGCRLEGCRLEGCRLEGCRRLFERAGPPDGVGRRAGARAHHRPVLGEPDMEIAGGQQSPSHAHAATVCRRERSGQSPGALTGVRRSGIGGVPRPGAESRERAGARPRQVSGGSGRRRRPRPDPVPGASRRRRSRPRTAARNPSPPSAGTFTRPRKPRTVDARPPAGGCRPSRPSDPSRPNKLRRHSTTEFLPFLTRPVK